MMKVYGAAKFIRVLAILLWSLSSLPSNAANPPALSGSVSSAEEGNMEGVLVSAKRDGSNITVTVVTDSQGRYAFPGERLPAGNYHVKIRAIGYDLTGLDVVRVEEGKTSPLNLRLQKTADISSQMTNAEWFMSNPEIKEKLIDGIGKMGVAHVQACIGCHPISVVLRSKFKPDDWPAILNRMANHSESSIYQPGEILISANRPYKVDPNPGGRTLGEFLSSVNLSASPDGKFNFALKTFPRLKGRSEKVIITEYDLPRRACQPHDAAVDKEGMVWYSDVGNGFVGRLNPKTGETKEWPVVNAEPELGTIGTASIRIDKDGNPVFGVESRERTGRLDKATGKITLWNVGGGKVSAGADGMIWTKDDSGKVSRIYKLNPKTGESVEYPVPEPIRFYDVNADSQGSVYASSLEKSKIGVLDGKTGKWTLYPTPTADAGPRRGDVDVHDRYWFAEYYSGKIGMFDPETKKIKEYEIPPLPWSGAYDLVVDKNGEVWGGGEYNDNVVRLNPATGEVTTYQLPTLEMNIQRMDVDNSTKPISVWAGENHRARIVKIEPLD
jgi:virginiamycin B lyase